VRHDAHLAFERERHVARAREALVGHARQAAQHDAIERGGNDGLQGVQLRYADRPEGPWSALDNFETLEATGGFGATFGALEHPGLRGECQQSLYVSYIVPVGVTDPGGMTATIYTTELVRVDLD
jgi:hypothetical protein